MVTLLCTVRNCRQTLVRDGRRLLCANGHSFDVARSGYVNLLQPQDRRSRQPGDSKQAALARRRFIEKKFEPPLSVASPATALDVGCGEGSHLAALNPGEGHGIDLSVPAIELAAKRYPQHHWIVANADRFLPYADHSFALVMSITSRLNPDEFRRVIRDDGQLVVALTAPDDLKELRAILHVEATWRDRSERTIAMFAPLFRLDRRQRVSTRATLERGDIDDLLASTYRGSRHREREKLRGLDTLQVTLSRDVLLFRPS